MSLISEALRKARAEAAEREGRRQGVPRALALPPKRSRSGLRVALIAAIALGAALAGGGIAWWALASHRAATRAAGGATARGTPAPGLAAAAGVADAGPEAAPRSSPPQQALLPIGDVSGAAGPSPAAAPVKAPRERIVSPAPSSGEPPRATPAPRPTQGTPGAEEGRESKPSPSAAAVERSAHQERERSFAIDADLGYAKLHLDYIVYRRGSPFAGINGGQVFVGSVIDGFTIEEIAEDSVRLRDSRGTVVLRIR